ncbi:hypothetical protein P7K49_015682 [Saguinus oedipus]|uniref:Uncharacterized protein n=1 Tax=Saguinus oedipus TaxID=9490 RepID=A0ABQ9V9Y5_SAGOE|nr:hypothetical protein P7K49_015682 [Saguinus oedipus]
MLGQDGSNEEGASAAAASPPLLYCQSLAASPEACATSASSTFPAMALYCLLLALSCTTLPFAQLQLLIAY